MHGNGDGDGDGDGDGVGDVYGDCENVDYNNDGDGDGNGFNEQHGEHILWPVESICLRQFAAELSCFL